MKKVFAIILAFLYLAASTGAAIHVHYCMGKQYAVDLVSKTSCSKCGMAQSGNNCCHDKITVLKVKDTHQAGNAGIHFSLPVCASHSVYPVAAATAFTNVVAIPAQNHSPPWVSGLQRCIFHCVFRI